MVSCRLPSFKLLHFLQLKKYPIPASLQHLRQKAMPAEVRATDAAMKEHMQLLRGNAKSFLPKVKSGGVVLQLYPKSNRYQVYYPTKCPPRSHSEVWHASQGISEAQALRACLQ